MNRISDPAHELHSLLERLSRSQVQKGTIASDVLAQQFRIDIEDPLFYTVLSVILERFDFASKLVQASDVYETQKERYSKALLSIRRMFTPPHLNRSWVDVRNECLNDTNIAAISMASVSLSARFKVPNEEEMNALIEGLRGIWTALKKSSATPLATSIIEGIERLVWILDRLEFFGNIAAIKALADVFSKVEAAEERASEAEKKGVLKKSKEALFKVAQALVFTSAVLQAGEDLGARAMNLYSISSDYIQSLEQPSTEIRMLESPDKFAKADKDTRDSSKEI